jgi:3'-phosphoadenosine 5'-phosphosulfate sulfotransferase (PAPS reductase)/FAD synthetase
MSHDPFLLDRPAVVSFSGGRTSGYMLRRVLDAFGSTLPDDVKVVFCNTGKERPQTLDFVERCSQRWGVPVVWLEYRRQAPHKFLVVDYATASRNGEPFEEIISAKPVLPNVVMRYCTEWLKVKISNRYIRHVLGWTPKTGGYHNAIGLRYDEPARIARLRGSPKTTPGEHPFAPLAQARVTEADVFAFWAAQPFDLELLPHEGNCDLCFLKGRHKLLRILKDRPDLAEWWVRQERRFVGKTRLEEAGRFSKSKPSYDTLRRQSQEAELFDELDDDIPDCRCTD